MGLLDFYNKLRQKQNHNCSVTSLKHTDTSKIRGTPPCRTLGCNSTSCVDPLEYEQMKKKIEETEARIACWEEYYRMKEMLEILGAAIREFESTSGMTLDEAADAQIAREEAERAKLFGNCVHEEPDSDIHLMSNSKPEASRTGSITVERALGSG
jgi:hypothetical protein